MKNPNRFSTLLYIFSLTGIWLTSFSCHAAISLDELRNQVQAYIRQQLEPSDQIQWQIEVRGLDPRINLDDCPNSIQFRLAGKQQSIERLNTIHASCQSDNEQQLIWSLYIPTEVKRMEPIIITSGPIVVGQLIEPNDVQVEYRDMFNLRGEHFSELADVVGSRVKHSLQQGQAIKSRNLCQVCKGEHIIIEAVGQGIRVKTDGIALDDGIKGEAIRVQNKRSGRKFSAEVVHSGHVQIKI